ncbi:MAG TPA: GTP-binding protein [candidate division Zixibacteria bacterium]|nr:GTP-binding protein [candidate division Zixibacteria bacterium]
MIDKKSSDFLWKIVLTGDSYVGKTTIRKRAMGEHFAEEYISTVGADFSSYKLKLGDLSIGFQVWDLAGQDKYKYIRSSFYGGATGCFLTYDVTNPKSLNSLSSWVDEAIRYSNGTIEIFIICANKIDLKGQREISRESGEQFTQALRESSGLQCGYIETSALTGENVDIAFDLMAKCLLEREGITPVKYKEEPISLPEEPKTEQTMEKLAKKEISLIKEKASEPEIKTSAMTKKPVLISDEDTEETDKLIAEVMSVLDETNDVIIGREITDDGERVITVPKNSFKEGMIEEEPRIAPELERVLQSINLKLDSLTVRLKDLEEEITHVKVNGAQIQNAVEKEQIDENIADLRKELEIFEQKESELIEDDISTEEYEEEEVDDEQIEIISEQQEQDVIDDIEELDSEELDQDQKVLESILSLETDSKVDETIDAPEIDVENESEFEEELEEKITELEEKEVTSTDVLDELINIPNDDLVELPEDDILESVEEESPSTDSIIGTELSSAMISELKDLSDEDTTQNEEFLTQPLQIDHEDEKKKCPICGEATKYIRQHNRHYCVKCGRYLI